MKFIFNSIIFLWPLLYYCACISTVTFENRAINAVTTYHFTIEDSLIKTISDPSAYLEINFYYSTEFVFDVPGSFTCVQFDEIAPSIDPPQSYNCRAIATNKITIDNPIITSDIFKVSVSSIKNPSCVLGPNLSFQFKLSDGTLIATNAISETTAYLPGTIQDCNLTFHPNQVHQRGVAQLDIVLANQLPLNADLLVQFWQAWPYEADSTFHPVSGNPFFCDNLSSLKTFPCIVSQSQQLWIYEAFYMSSNPGGSLRSFRISNIWSPPTDYNSYSVNIITGHQASSTVTGGKTVYRMNNVVDQGLCYVRNIQPKLFTQLFLSFENASVTVGQENKLGISFQSPLDILSTDYLEFNFHQEMIDSSVLPSFLGLTCVTGFSTFDCSFSRINNTQYRLYSLPLIPKYSWVNITPSIPFKPHTSSGAKILKISANRQGSKYVQQYRSIAILPSSPAYVSYMIFNDEKSNIFHLKMSIRLKNELYQKSVIKLQLPTSFNLSSSNCSYLLNASMHIPPILSQKYCAVTSPQTIIIRLSQINITNKFASEQILTLQVTFQTTNNVTPPQLSNTTYQYIYLIAFYNLTISDPLFQASLYLYSIMTLYNIPLVKNTETTKKPQFIIGLSVGILGLGIIVAVGLGYKFYWKKRLVRKQWIYDGFNDVQFKM